MTNVIRSPSFRVYPGLSDLDVRANLGDPAGALGDRFHCELAARDVGKRGGDAVRGNCYLEESAAELFVGNVVVILHRCIPSHVTCHNGR